MNCPNKAHPDWKYLVDRFGEDGAWYLYLKYDEEIPNQAEANKLSPTLIAELLDSTKQLSLFPETTPSYYTGDIKPEENTIFVFGSNPEGRHGAGAAKKAITSFGAVYGQGEGLQGNSYALPTKDLRVKENKSAKSIDKQVIIESIKKLYQVARENPTKQFKVAYRNVTEVSLNGYTGLEMIEMFNAAGEKPSNVLFSKEWVDTGKVTSTTPTIKKELPANPAIKAVYDSVVIPGFTVETQDQTVQFLTEQVLFILEAEEEVSFLDAQKTILTYLKTAPEGGASYLKPIVDNFEEFSKLVLQRLEQMAILNKTQLRRKFDTETNEPITVGEGEVLDSFYWKDDWVFSFDAKTNAQKEIKKFLLMIPDTIINEEGELEERRNYLGAKMYLPYDQVFEELKGLLADLPSNWAAMEERMREKQKDKPWIWNLLYQMESFNTRYVTKEYAAGVTLSEEDYKILSKEEQDKYQQVYRDKDRLKHQFVTTMSSTYNDFKTLVWSEQDGQYDFKLVATDQSSIISQQISAWKNNFYDTKHYTEADTAEGVQIVPNEEYVEGTLKALEALKVDPGKLDAFMRRIGVPLSLKTINLIQEGKFLGLSFEKHFTSGNGLFKLIGDRLRKVGGTTVDAEDVVNPIVNNSAIRGLASFEASTNPALYSNSMRNGENNIVYSYGFNKLITDQLRKLGDDNFFKALSELSFQAPNIHEDQPLYKTWIYSLQKNKELFLSQFNISPFDTVKESLRLGTSLSDLGDVDLELTQWNLFRKGHEVKGLGQMANFLFTIPSKTTSYVFTAPKLLFTLSKDGKFDPIARNAIYNIALSELQRIKSGEAKKKNLKTNKYRTGYNKFYFFPILNEDREGPNSIWHEDGTIKLPTTKLANGKTVETVIREKIEAILYQDIDTKIEYWSKAGFVKDGKVVIYKGEEDARKAASDYVLNNTLFNFNLHQTFIGDPALFSKGSVSETWDEVGKRLAAMIAPGRDLSLQGGERFISVKAVDREGAISNNIKQLRERLGPLAAGYEKHNGTDGQEFVTWQEQLFIAQRTGAISTREFNAMTAKLKAGLDLTERELVKAFAPLKPVYTNQEISKTEDAMILEYVKSSSIPLLPQFTKGLEIDKLRIALEALEKEQTEKSTKKSGGMPVQVRLSFESATKTGGVKAVEIFNADGTIKNNINFTGHYKSLSREGFRIQQDVPHDPNDVEIVKATQPTKLLFDSILEETGFELNGKEYKGRDLKQIWNSLHKTMFEYSADELRHRITKADGTLDIAKVQEVVVEEAIKRGYTPAEIASLVMDAAGKNFEYPFWALNSSKKFESILTSLFTNTIVKQEMHGQALVLTSEEGMQGKSKDITYTRSYDPAKGLQPMRVEYEGAETVIKDADELLKEDIAADLKGKEVSILLIDPKTGNRRIGKEVAGTGIAEIKKQHKKLEALLKCLTK
jgi:hypothetical protein